MSHLAPEPPNRRRAEYAIGAFIVLLGVAVLVIAVVALRNPQGRQAAKASATITTQPPTKSGTATKTKPHTSASGHASTPATKTTTPASGSSSNTSATPTGTSSAGGTPDLATLRAIPLIVLNNTEQTGLAQDAASRFESGGWTVTSTDNLDNDILSTCAYYDPSDPNNELAAQELQREFPTIKRVVPKFDGLPAGPIVVVLTTDYS
jgi:hypothetical protein